MNEIRYPTTLPAITEFIESTRYCSIAGDIVTCCGQISDGVFSYQGYQWQPDSHSVTDGQWRCCDIGRSFACIELAQYEAFKLLYRLLALPANAPQLSRSPIYRPIAQQPATWKYPERAWPFWVSAYCYSDGHLTQMAQLCQLIEAPDGSADLKQQFIEFYQADEPDYGKAHWSWPGIKGQITMLFEKDESLLSYTVRTQTLQQAIMALQILGLKLHQ